MHYLRKERILSALTEQWAPVNTNPSDDLALGWALHSLGASGYNLFSLEPSCSIFYKEDAGDESEERTEEGDNGIRPEGGWACSLNRSILSTFNKSWPLRGFIRQYSGLLSSTVSEPGIAPLGLNSQGISRSETQDTAQLVIYLSYYNSMEFLWTWCSFFQVLIYVWL